MRKRGSSADGPNKPLAVFATVLVVAGIAAVAYVASVRPGDRSVRPVVTEDGIDRRDAPSSTEPVVAFLRNETSVTLLRKDGTTERLSAEAFGERFPDVDEPWEGSLVSNGAPVRYAAATSAASGPGALSPDGASHVRIGTAQADGASVLLLQRASESERKLVLRDAKNQALRNASVAGWFDERTIMATAVPTSSRWAYAVGVDGRARALAPLPETIVSLFGRGGAVWYVTATPGEGLESPPKAPSELRRIGSDGSDQLVAKDELHVFLMVVSGPDGRFAFTTDDGKSAAALEDGTHVSLGKRRPLVFLPDGRILLRDGFSLVLFDLRTGTTTPAGTVPEGNVEAYALPNLDMK